MLDQDVDTHIVNEGKSKHNKSKKICSCDSNSSLIRVKGYLLKMVCGLKLFTQDLENSSKPEAISISWKRWCLEFQVVP